MTMEQAVTLLKAHGWTPIERTRGRNTFLYAARTVRYQRSEVYIGKVSRLANMTDVEVLAKLPTKKK